MKKTLILVTIFIIAAGSLQAKDDTLKVWNKSVDFSFVITQTAYSDSWTGGEAGNATWISQLNALFEGPISEKFYSKSTAKLAFGQTHIQDKDTKEWAKPVKSTDEIDIESVASYRSKWFVNPYFSVRFESQFLDASVENIDRFLNPITVTEAAGFTKRLYEREKQFIDTRIGFALKEHFNRVIIDTVTEKTETETSTEGGLESVTDMQIKPHANINISSRLSFYKPLTVSDETRYWSTLEAELKNAMTAKITKYFNVVIYLEWLYDKDIDKRGRLKETLGLGFTYSLM